MTYRLSVENVFKIGYYASNKKLKMALGTAAVAPVRYERSPWNLYQTSYPEVEDNLPKDPRQWTRDDVATWVKFLTSQHRLPEVPTSRFLMNGKALCLMTPSMFLDRVPLGGKLFYKDFQLRLSSSLYASN